MVSCCVSDCPVSGTYNPNKCSFHKFPCQAEISEKWIRVIGRQHWTPKKNSVVCSKHFEQKLFLQRSGRRTLTKDSIPTLFVPVKLNPKRPVSSYVYRDIALPLVDQALPAQSLSGTSSAQALSPRTRKLMDINARLKRKIVCKNKALRSLKAKTERLTKQLVTLQEVVKDVEERGQASEITTIHVACHNCTEIGRLVNK